MGLERDLPLGDGRTMQRADGVLPICTLKTRTVW